VLYRLFEINRFELGSLSSLSLQSTDCEMTVHLKSMSASSPLYMGAAAERAPRMGVNGVS